MLDEFRAVVSLAVKLENRTIREDLHEQDLMCFNVGLWQKTVDDQYSKDAAVRESAIALRATLMNKCKALTVYRRVSHRPGRFTELMLAAAEVLVAKANADTRYNKDAAASRTCTA